MRHFTWFSLLLFPFFSAAQALPKDWYLTDGGKVLVQGGKEVTGFYNESKIRQINILFKETNYWTLLASNYSAKRDLMATIIIDGERFDSVGVRFKGMTSYNGGPGGGGGAATSQKKSFNISFDAFKANPEKVSGYKTLNLNNSFQDPSFMREVFYTHSIRPYAYSAKANFVHLYINDQDWGLYQNVQQLNGDFLEERFLNDEGNEWRADPPTGGGGGFGDGTAALNYLGEDTLTYKKYYTLNGGRNSSAWKDLVNLTRVLNQTPLANLEAALKPLMDLDRTLWHLASEIAFSDDDSYVYKGKMDYFVYQDAVTGRFVPMEYDGNSACTANLATWSPFYNEAKVNYPLMNRLFAVPALRQRYIAHLYTILQEAFDDTKVAALLETYRSRIDTIVQKDPKKTTTYAQFQTGVPVLRKFMSDRKASILSNAEFKAYAPPTINNADAYVYNQRDQKPSSNDVVTIKSNIRANSSSSVQSVYLYYGTGLTGGFTKLAMTDDGMVADEVAGDGVYTAIIPAQTAGSWVRYYVEATSNNTSKSVSYLPVGAEHSVFVYQVQQNSAVQLGDVVINEIMAANTKTVKDEKGDYEDWIELYNRSNQSIDISDYVLTDNPTNLTKWRFAKGTVIPAGGYLTVWADEDSKDNPTHTNFKLSASGELVYLLNGQGVFQDSITFGPQVSDMSLSRVPNGTGNFVIKNPTFGFNNEATSGSHEAVAGPTDWQMYPNPAQQQVHLVTESTLRTDVLVFNTFGQLLLRTPLQPNLTLDVSQYPAGVYVVQCGMQQKRLVIARANE